MQILSLNTNGFSGTSTKKSKSPINCNVAEKILKKIFDKGNPEIILFSEFDVHSPAGDKVIQYLHNEKNYYIIYPNKLSDINPQYSSIVLMFSKKKVISEESLGLQLKWNEILYGEYRIVGVHIPDSTREADRSKKYWDDILLHFQKHKDENVIYIGDMNVFINGTLGKKKLNDLIQEGANDAWIEKNGTKYDIEKSYTFMGKTRVDYAIMSQTASIHLNKMENIQEFYKEDLSDHSALLIDLN